MKNWSDDKWDRVMRLPEEEQAKYLEESFEEELSYKQQRDLLMLPDEGFEPMQRRKSRKAYAKYLRKKGRRR